MYAARSARVDAQQHPAFWNLRTQAREIGRFDLPQPIASVHRAGGAESCLALQHRHRGRDQLPALGSLFGEKSRDLLDGFSLDLNGL